MIEVNNIPKMGSCDKLKCSCEDWPWSRATSEQFVALWWSNSLTASLIWRSLVFGYFVFHLIYNYYINTWEICPLAYLTNWGELTNTIYALLSFSLVAHYRLQSISLGTVSSYTLKFTAFLWEVQSTIAIMITVLYYTLDNVFWTYSAINLHLSNSIITLIDLFMIDMPRECFHFGDHRFTQLYTYFSWC